MHWLKAPPAEQEAQSGWQGRQAPAVENVPEGQADTQLPFKLNRLLAHVRQNVDVPEQVLHEESQANKKIE